MGRINVGTKLLCPLIHLLLGTVSNKCPEFFKCLKCSKSGFPHFEFFWMPKGNSTIIKRPMYYDYDGNNNKVYPNIIVNFYHLVHIIRR